MNFWILLSLFGWVVKCRDNQLDQTNCTSLNLLHKSNYFHRIRCGSNKKIYISKQIITYKFGGGRSLIEERQCPNSTDCFRSIPDDFKDDFTLYFNASQYCNRRSQCTLGGQEYYRSATKFWKFCQSCCKTDNFYKMRMAVYSECLPGENFISIKKKLITEKLHGSLYLLATNSNQCSLKGSIESARIMEQNNVNLSIVYDSNFICSDVQGMFNYNKDLSCINGVNGIVLNFEFDNSSISSKILWIEIKGSSLQLACGDVTASHLDPKQLKPHEPDASLSVLVIISSVVGAIVLITVIVVICIFKRKHSQVVSKNRTKHELGVPVRSTTTRLDEGIVYYNDTRTAQGNEEEQGTVSPSNKINPKIDTAKTSLNFEDGNYSFIEHGLKNEKTTGTNKAENCMKTSNANEGVYNMMNELGENSVHSFSKSCSNRADRKENTRQHSEAVKTMTNQFIGEVTGDVYASVCKIDNKIDNLKNSRITGPKGDVYTTVYTLTKAK